MSPPGREGEIACAAAGEQSILLGAGGGIEHGHVAGDAVGDEEALAGEVFYDAGRLRADAPGGDDGEHARIDDGEGVVPGVGYEEAVAVGRECDAAGNAADGNGFDGRIGGCIEDAHLFALLAEDVKARAVGREEEFERRCVVEIFAGGNSDGGAGGCACPQ